MFRNAERARQVDRGVVGRERGHVGRDVGDLPYVMDLVKLEHFAAQGIPLGFFEDDAASIGSGSGDTLSVTGLTARRLTTGTTTSSVATLAWENIANPAAGKGFMAGFTRDASLRGRYRWSAIDANAVLLTGLITGIGSTNGFSEDGLFFGALGSESTDYFVAISRDGGVATTRILNGDGGMFAAPVDTGWHEVAIICDVENAEVRFYFDRRLTATLESDLPDDSTDYLEPWLGVKNGATATARTLDIDVLVLSEAAP